MPPFSETRATACPGVKASRPGVGRDSAEGKGTTAGPEVRLFRSFIVSLVLSCIVFISVPVGAAAQTDDRLAEAADAARELSVLEAERDFDALYERMHPDALAVVPRSAVVGWYESTFRNVKPASWRSPASSPSRGHGRSPASPTTTRLPSDSSNRTRLTGRH